MFFQMALIIECSWTYFTFKWFLSTVRFIMPFQSASWTECIWTNFTCIGLFTTVYYRMFSQIAIFSEWRCTNVTFKWFLFAVPFNMTFQINWPTKCRWTDCTFLFFSWLWIIECAIGSSWLLRLQVWEHAPCLLSISQHLDGLGTKVSTELGFIVFMSTSSWFAQQLSYSSETAFNSSLTQQMFPPIWRLRRHSKVCISLLITLHTIHMTLWSLAVLLD